jgi:hypothetical protein
MKTKILLAVGVGMLVGWSMPQIALAQDDDGPGWRTVHVISFELPPLGERGPFFRHLRDRIEPGILLNPHVITSRVMIHNYGSNASQIILVREYANWADMGAGCGQPCADYREANRAPAEGDEGYDDFVEGRDLWRKYFSHHRDEIYSAFMGVAKSEGEIMGTVGAPDDDGDDD